MKFISLCFSVFVALLSFGQYEDLDELKIMYADGNYEKLIAKSEKLADKDDTKKNPFVYLWMSRGYFGISRSGEADPEFKNAFKNGMSAFAKAVKYDDSTTQALVKHGEFVKEFTLSAAERIINDIEVEDYRKAYGWGVKYSKMAKDVAGYTFLEGALKYRNSDRSGANNAWKEAEQLLENVESLSGWWEADIKLLKRGVIETARCHLTSRQVDKARDVLDKYLKFFENDEEYAEAYEELKG